MYIPLFHTAYAAPVEYYRIWVNSQNRLLEYHENYSKQTIRNRCRILTANGPLNLIVPVKHTGSHQLIHEVKTDDSFAWQRQHWRTIESAYKRSPYFDYYKDELKKLYETPCELLWVWNQKIHRFICNIIGASPNFECTQMYEPKLESEIFDLRECRFENESNNINYLQVFSDRFGFVNNLSVLDLCFNLGPNSLNYLSKMNQSVNN